MAQRVLLFSPRHFSVFLLGVACLIGHGRSTVAAERVTFVHNDLLGSPVAVTDTAGNLVSRIDYAPFGSVVSEAGTAHITHRFTGKEEDAETGFHYFGARYYDARLGRFLSVDPALLGGRPDPALIGPQLLNLFAYGANNPFRFVDPDGRFVVHLEAAKYRPDPARIARYEFYERTALVGVGTAAAGTAAVAGAALAPEAALVLAARHPQFAAVAAAAAAAEAGVATRAVGFAPGTAISALTDRRLQHGSRRLIEKGLLPAWNETTTKQKFVELATRILEQPIRTFDHVMKRGGEPVKGFLGKVDGQPVVIFVFKAGRYAGELATSIVPSKQQLIGWGLAASK